MYIDSNNQGLHHPGFKISSILKTKLVPQWPIAQNEFRITREFETEFEKNVANETGAQIGSIDEKRQRRKTSRYVPFNNEY